MVTAKPTEADRFSHLTNTVHDHSSVLQALQVDMRHAVKLLDKLVTVADKQAELSHELTRHSDSIDRAFKQMDGVESKLAKAIDALTMAFKEDRDKSETVAETVTGYKGGLKAMMLVGGALTALLFVIGGMFATSVAKDQARNELALQSLGDNWERRKLFVDIKLEALSQAVQEVRLDRQRDRETEAAKP